MPTLTPHETPHERMRYLFDLYGITREELEEQVLELDPGRDITPIVQLFSAEYSASTVAGMLELIETHAKQSQMPRDLRALCIARANIEPGHTSAVKLLKAIASVVNAYRINITEPMEQNLLTFIGAITAQIAQRVEDDARRGIAYREAIEKEAMQWALKEQARRWRKARRRPPPPDTTAAAKEEA